MNGVLACREWVSSAWRPCSGNCCQAASPAAITKISLATYVGCSQNAAAPSFSRSCGCETQRALSHVLLNMQRAINLTPAQVEDCIALRVCYLQKLAQVLKRRKQITTRLAWVEDHSLSHTGRGLDALADAWKSSRRQVPNCRHTACRRCMA